MTSIKCCKKCFDLLSVTSAEAADLWADICLDCEKMGGVTIWSIPKDIEAEISFLERLGAVVTHECEIERALMIKVKSIDSHRFCFHPSHIQLRKKKMDKGEKCK